MVRAIMLSRRATICYHYTIKHVIGSCTSRLGCAFTETYLDEELEGKHGGAHDVDHVQNMIRDRGFDVACRRLGREREHRNDDGEHDQRCEPRARRDVDADFSSGASIGEQTCNRRLENIYTL